MIVHEILATMVVGVVVVYSLLLANNLKFNHYQKTSEKAQVQAQIIEHILKVDALIKEVYAKVSELEEQFMALKLQKPENKKPEIALETQHLVMNTKLPSDV
jgi:hypothetical protein